ncbi:hypothetical protein BsWGS_27502 [Bradybaena similaris]
MSSSLGRLPTFISPRPRSALSSTPRVNINQPKYLPYPGPNSTSAPVSRSPGIHSATTGTKRTRGCSSNQKPSRRQPCRRVYLGAPRCSRIGPYMLPPMFGYKNFGRSSDYSVSKTGNTNTNTRIRNPYAQLAKEVKQMMRQKADSPCPLSTPKQTGATKTPAGSASAPVNLEIVNKGESTKMASGVADSLDDRSSRENEAQDAELCDDEEELYRELRSNENSDEARVQFEMYRALHLAQMESICKVVPTRRLLRQLQGDGYFDYNYQSHVRAPAETSSMKQKVKKPTDRLHLLLSIK